MNSYKFKQSLPDYCHKFLRQEWIIRESENYIFHYFPNSDAEKDIDEIINRQEKSFSKIIEFLGVKNPIEKIEYYFYPSEKYKEKLMGDDGFAQAIFSEFRIHVVYTKDIKPIGEHEDTHLLSLSFGLSIGFFQEGLAEFMVGKDWFGGDQRRAAKDAIDKKLCLNFVEMFEHKKWYGLDFSSVDSSRVIYSVAGDFVRFLIEKFGEVNFLEFYKKSDRENSQEKNIEIFENIFGDLGIVTKKYLEMILGYNN